MTTFQRSKRHDAAGDPILQPLLTEHDVARIFGLTVETVGRWRTLKKGPPFIKVGQLIRYAPADVSAWLKSRRNGGDQTREAAA